MGRNNGRNFSQRGRSGGNHRNNPFNRQHGGGFNAGGPRGGRGGPKRFGHNNWNSKQPGGGGDKRHGPPKLSELKEEQVFVTEYVSAGEGFRGILKSRFSDFHVNEIDCEGNEAVLTELKAPDLPREENDDPDDVEQELAKLITQEKVDQIRKVAVSLEKCADVIEVDATEMSKEDRGKIHNGAKSLFGGAIVGSTVTRDDRKYITFAMFNKKAKQDRRVKWPWPGQFTHFLLYKENIDTIQATGQLTEHVKCSPSAFAYAGTKDRRAKTTQWISIRYGDPAKIAAAGAKIRNIRIGNFSFRSAPLKLGQLRGNRFQIALRQVTAKEDVIRQSVENFREKGFINYFGLQRFGNCASIPTYKVGIEMLKGEWKEACDLVLKPREGDPWFMQQVREIWQKTGDAQAAFDKFFYSNKSIEKSILKWLATHKNDYRGAFEHLPRNMRLLYGHSYQSLIFNRVASRRIREFGCSLVPGDLVFVDKSTEGTDGDQILDVEAALEENETSEADVPAEEEKEGEDPAPEAVSHFKNLVKPLSKEDIASGQYSIFDIVLPLPGHDISYPANDCAKWYEELLAEDGLSSEKLKQKTKKHSLGGAYRKVFVKPENMEWKLVSYNKPDDTLILSDLEKLNGGSGPLLPEDGKNRALLLDFRLPSSSYATMALREILKVDTSALSQRTLEQEETAPKSATDDELPAPADEVADDAKPVKQEAIEENVAGEDDDKAGEDPPLKVENVEQTPTAVPGADGEEPAEKKIKLE